MAERHSRMRAGITGAVVAVVIAGGLQAVPGWAGERAWQRRWRSADELVASHVKGEATAILEVKFRYDVDAAPALQFKRAMIKRGYAPQYEPVTTGHVLSLHAANGDALSSLTFQIPNVIYGPPPLPGDTPGHGPTALRAMDFSLTVPMIEGAVELRVADPQGLVVIQESLRNVPVRGVMPSFRSLPSSRGGAGGSSRLPWQRLRLRVASWVDGLLMETAEAAGDPAALDITFVGDNYAAADLVMFQQDVDRVIDHLLTYEPYATRSAQILFHSVDNTTADLGCVHSASMDRLITCNNAAVTSVVNDAGAPYDKIIVLVKDATYGGSGGSLAVSYNGSSAAQVVAHEFGHALGGLLDEYNLYTTNGSFTGATQANCYAGAPPDSLWDGLVSPAQYALGCKYPNWYRSSACSIMLSLSCQYFNEVSKQALNTKLDFYASGTAGTTTTPAPAPSLTLSGTPTLLGLNGSSLLTWTGANATSCTASGAWSGAKPVSGSQAVTPSATSTYTLTCSGSGSATQSVTLTVDGSAPTVSLTAPVDGSTVSGTVAVSASASDNQQVDRVDFFKDGALLGSDNSIPHSVNWNTGGDTPGAHTLTSKAVDRAGNLGVSSPVVVTVASASSQDIQAPQVQFTMPADGSRLDNSTRVIATATDNVKVTRMELRLDGQYAATGVNGKVSANWRTGSLAPGAHSIEVKAFDAAGNVGTATLTVYK